MGIWLFPSVWTDKTTERKFVQTRRFSRGYAEWQEVVKVIGPLWRQSKYPPFRDWSCNFTAP